MPEEGLEQGLKGLGDTKGDMFVAAAVLAAAAFGREGAVAKASRTDTSHVRETSVGRRRLLANSLP